VIRYSLRCGEDHEFDSWFRSVAAFETLAERGDLSCPECGSGDVAKALMAPRVGGTERSEPPSPAQVARALREVVEKNSEYVGDRFVSEARQMHDGVAPKRAIWGEAKAEEARKLVEDGVPVAPLPFVPQRKMN
jgi:hypothetical protein